MLPVFVYEDFCISNGGILGFLGDLSTIRYWVDNSNTNTPWFVPFILLLYVLYPLFYRIDVLSKHKAIVALCLLSVFCIFVFSYYSFGFYSVFSSPINRIPIFLFGVILAKEIKNGILISKVSLVVAILLFIILNVVLFVIDCPLGIEMLFVGCIGLCLIYIYSAFRLHFTVNLLAKTLSFVGCVSLEVYLVHTVILRVVDRHSLSNYVFASLYIILPLISIGISWCYQLIISMLFRNKKVKNGNKKTD